MEVGLPGPALGPVAKPVAAKVCRPKQGHVQVHRQAVAEKDAQDLTNIQPHVTGFVVQVRLILASNDDNIIGNVTLS